MEKSFQINEKTKKSEIIDAYNDLLLKVQEEKKTSLKDEKQKQLELKIVKEVSSNSSDNIVKTLSNAKLEIIKMIDHIGSKITEEQKKLIDVQRALEIETKNLDEVYQIKINAESLEALLRAQKEKKQEFETEINKQKISWKLEEEKYKQDREREEDEYNYVLKTQRRKEQDAYNLKKEKLEKEFTDRELNIINKEAEYENLKKQVETFPKILEKHIKESEENTRVNVERNYKFEKELSIKEIESERKLYEQTLKSLQEKIKEQDAIIKQLSLKTDFATQQVQTIAIKAIESSSFRVFSSSSNENTKAVHQT